MGMYTELVLKADVQQEPTKEVLNILNFLFNGQELDIEISLPKHKFFTLPRWKQLGRSNSYYHVPWANSKYEEDYIFSRSDLKDYDEEIDNFLDWVRPYLTSEEGKCIGWKWYEEDNIPTLIIM
jgi:hypothetical protein